MGQSKNIDEALDVISQVLLRCVIIGVAVLCFWWGALVLMGDFAYSVHSKIVPITRAQFDVIHYAGMLATKAGVSLFFFFPYIAIKWVKKR